MPQAYLSGQKSCGRMHLWRRGLLRSQSKGSAPAPADRWHPPSGAPSSPRPQAITNRKGKGCSRNIIWICPCVQDQQCSLSSALLRFSSWLIKSPLPIWHRCGPGKSPLGARRVMWKETPRQCGDRQESPHPCCSPGQLWAGELPAGAQPEVCMSSNKVLGDPSGWKALCKCKHQPAGHQEAPL